MLALVFTVRRTIIASAVCFALVLLLCSVGSERVAGNRPPACPRERAATPPARPALPRIEPQLEGWEFVENAGQWETRARFVAHEDGRVVRVEPESLVFELGGRAVVRLAFEGASGGAALEGEGRLRAVTNFFLGNDPSRWRSGVARFRAVRARGLYDGVDLYLRGCGDALEYDLRIAAGADHAAIAVRCEGASGLRLDQDGDLVVETAGGRLRQAPPVAWQETPDGAQIPIECRYLILDDQRFGFDVASRDPGFPLVIDPGLSFATLVGSAVDDTVGFPHGLAVGPAGEVTVVGWTDSLDFPTTERAYDRSFGGVTDACISRLSGDGTQLLWSTLLGGSGAEWCRTVAIEPNSGDVTVAGSTASDDFPTTPDAYDRRFHGAGRGLLGDAYVARLDATGGALLYSTYLGGRLDDRIQHVVLDPDGALWAAGWTGSDDFPTTRGAYSESFTVAGEFDTFVLRLNAATPGAGGLEYATFLGGTGEDKATSIAVDREGLVTVAGRTDSRDFPTTPGTFQRRYGGGNRDAYVARLDRRLTGQDQLAWATYLGGCARENGFGMEIDAAGTVTLVGWTESPDFPTTPGAFDRIFNGVGDAYVARLDTDGAHLLYGTFIGGSDLDGANGVALDPTGSAIVTGAVGSGDFPTTEGAFDRTFNGRPGAGRDVFVLRLRLDGGGASDLVYSTYLGGALGDDDAFEAQLAPDDPFGAAIVGGFTQAADFPTTNGAYDSTYDGGKELFVARLPIAENRTLSIGLSARATTVAPGAVLSFDVSVTNHTADQQAFAAWFDVTGPRGRPFERNPVIGPRAADIGPGSTVGRLLRLRIPARVRPSGPYVLAGRIGAYPGCPVSTSSFSFSVRE